MHVDPVLSPAVDVIRRTDPATYATMDASPWTVYAIRDGSEDSLAEFADREGPWQTMALVDALNSAFGATLGKDNTVEWLTFINVPLTVDKARDMNVPPVAFFADVLVHEFTHNGDGHRMVDETGAHKASIKFAQKLPPAIGEPIARLSAQTLGYEYATGNH